jgi:hypothetical protein
MAGAIDELSPHDVHAMDALVCMQPRRQPSEKPAWMA